jgi:DNA-binding CsgD family transcriptional regulator/tetratricopeptide (TPR) repeat protein
VLGSGRAELATLVPDLAAEDLDQAPPPSVLTSGLAQARLFERVLGVVRALAASNPVVLVVEDVHWIDRATRDLLTFLSRNLTDEPVAVLLTLRTDHLPPGHPILAWLAELERIASTAIVDLPRLDRAGVEEQLRHLAGRGPDAAVAEDIWRRCDGNPLFVEELFAAGEGQGGAGMGTVQVLLARVARLDPAARAAVDAVAVAGRPVDERLLADILELPEPDVDAPLRAALDNGVLELAPGTDRYRFRHELLREAVERELLPGARRRLHERCARRLEARPELADRSPAGAAGELAVHFAAAGLADEAYHHSIAAAGAAEAVHAYADALRHLERAIGLETRGGRAAAADGHDGTSPVEVRLRAADAADLSGAAPRGLELATAALALVDPVADPVSAGLVHSRIGFLRWSLGEGDAALRSHEEAVRLVPAEPPTPERARVLGALGGALMGAGRWAESRVVCEAAIACAIQAGAPAEESRARNMLGSDLVALGDVDAGIEQLREACRIAEVAGRVDMRILGFHNLALNLAAADRLEEAVDQATSGIRLAREVGLERRSVPDLAAIVGDTLLRLGRVDEAEAVVGEALGLDPRREGTVYLSTVRARIASTRGDFAEALERRAAIDLDAQDPDVAALVATVAAETLAWSGRPEEAVREAEAGLGHLDALDDVLWSAPLVALGLRGFADLAEGRPAARGAVAGSPRGAHEEADPIAAFRGRLDRIGTRASTTSCRGWVALARGELARATGGGDARHWDEAIEAFDAVPEPLQGAYARLRAAEAGLHAHGLRAAVTPLVHEAAAVAARTGARPLADAVAALAGRARIPAAAAASDPAALTPPAGEAEGAPVQDARTAAMALGLSAREVEVLELVTAGMTNGEIAARLFITRKTAAVHVTHILDKLGVANRVSAAMIGARVGLGSTGDDQAPVSDRMYSE